MKKISPRKRKIIIIVLVAVLVGSLLGVGRVVLQKYNPRQQDNKIHVGNYSAHIVKVDSKKAQKIVDAKGECAKIQYGNRTVYVDHATNGFSNISNTDEMIINGERYYCIYRTNGENYGNGIKLKDGTNFDVIYENCIIAYTCKDKDGIDVIVTYWQPIAKRVHN